MRRLCTCFQEQILRIETDEQLTESFLFEIYTLIKGYSLSNLFGNEEVYNECYVILQEKFPFIKKYITFDSNNNDLYIKVDAEDVLTTARLLNTLETKVTETEDIYSLLSILITYNFLGIDYRHIIKIDNIDKEILSKVKEEICNIVLSLRSNISSEINTSYNEKQLINHYIKGTEEKDIDSIYEFIEAAERGRGIYPPSFLDEVVIFLYFVDIEKYINVLNNKKQMIEIIFLLNAIAIDEKFNLISQDSLNNKWVMYELFRQIIIENKQNDLSENNKEYLCNVLIKTAEYDVNFFKKMLIRHKNDRNFNIILGNCLNRMDTKYLDIFLNTISVDKYNLNIENNRLFMNNFIETDNEAKVRYLCQQIYNKWDESLDSVLKNNQYLNDILYSDYYYCVLHYLVLEYDEDKFFIALNKVLKHIEDMMTIWKSSSNYDLTYFFVGVTRLYTLSLVYSIFSMLTTFTIA